jgi:DNA-binding transcriptional LysR family regulator
MDLNKLKVFHVVADIGGVSASSSVLKMSQSSISTTLSSIENEMGCKLFERHFRGMNLTEKGKIFYKSSKTIIEEYELLKNIINVDSDKVEGNLIISSSFGITSSMWFLKKIIHVIKKYPDLNLTVVDYKEDGIDSIPADVFICPYIYDRADLIQENINNFHFRLYASKEYIIKHGEPKNYDDLDKHFLIAFSKEMRNPFNDADSLLHIGRASSNPRNIGLEVNSSIALVRLVKEGLGIASLVVEEANSDNLVPLLLHEEDKIIKSCLIYQRKNKDVVKIKKFSEAFLEFTD